MGSVLLSEMVTPSWVAGSLLRNPSPRQKRSERKNARLRCADTRKTRTRTTTFEISFLQDKIVLPVSMAAGRAPVPRDRVFLQHPRLRNAVRRFADAPEGGSGTFPLEIGRRSWKACGRGLRPPRAPP